MIRLTLAAFVSIWAVSAAAAVDIREEVSPGGIAFWLVEEPSIPFVALEITIEGGGSLDREGKRGSVNLMTALLEEGSAEMDARTFQEAREALAASFGFEAFDDSVSVSARFLTENKEEAVALLRQALVSPRFDEDAIERVRAQVLSGIASDAQRPNRIAGDAFYAAAFPGHPYGSDMSGTVESVTALTRDDLLAAHADAVTQDRIHVAVVGDTDAATAGALIDALLGDLPETSPPPAEDVSFGLAGGVTVIDFPTPQSVALFGHSGLKRDDPDFFAAHVLNHILGGGGFESRLMTEVREKRGLTYGISTFLVPRTHAELVIGSVASSNDRIAEAIAVIRAEWARIASEGVTQAELDAAKTYITGEYPLRFTGNGPIAEIMVGMQTIDLGPDYVVNRNDFIEAVTLEDVNRVAAELLRPDALHFVVVGQPEGLASGPLPEVAAQ
jgi:zinc protease